MENQTQNMEKEKICCPKFQPEKYNEKVFNWKNKKFIETSMCTLFHIPFPWTINKKISKLLDAAKQANVETPSEETLMLFHDSSLFKSNILLSVNKQVQNQKNTELSGEFLSKVYQGQYAEVSKFLKEMEEYVKTKNKIVDKIYTHFAYCPGCVKKFGKNYMVFFAKTK